MTTWWGQQSKGGSPASYGMVVRKDFLEEEASDQGGRMTGTHSCPHSNQETCVSIPGPLVPKDFWLDLEPTTLDAFAFPI